MDSRFSKIGYFFILLGCVQCSNKSDTPITDEAKTQTLASMSVLSAKTTCVPARVVDEEDIPGLISGGYVYDGRSNQYCLGGPPTPGTPDDNCIPEQFLDPQDISVIIEQGYYAGENGYCNSPVTPPVTEPPVTEPPVVTPPVVEPPDVDDPPITIPPVVIGPPVTPPVTEPPVVEPPVTPPVTEPPVVVNPPVLPPVYEEPEEPSEPELPPWKIPNDRVCSKMRSGNGRYTLVTRESLVVQVVKRVVTSATQHNHTQKNTSCSSSEKKKHTTVKTTSYEVLCEITDTAKIRDSIVKNKKLDLTGCDISAHNRKDVYLTIFSPVVAKDKPVSTYDYDNTRFFASHSEKRGLDVISFILLGSREYRYMQIDQKLSVIVDNNPDGDKNDPKHCDQKASPLIVHINPDHDVARAVQLSSIADGILFDILGRNAEPKAHAKKQISWLDSDQYMFLVKPNSSGKVSGVDEMFGDNTYGPDKDFSANGFDALAKYDGMSADGKTRVADADGYINSADPVYSQLRLWNDKNKNGVSEKGELFTLKEMKVKTIDLQFDARFREQDRYGNETVYKSVIQYEDGSLDLIFDLWFNYRN